MTDMELFLYTLSASLIDGLSTTPQILILLFLLTTERPVVRNSFYILGISFFYLLAGILATFEFTRVHELFNRLNGLVDSQPDKAYYFAQIVLGAGLIALAAIYYFKRPKEIDRKGKVSRLLRGLNGPTAFFIGSIVTIGGLPGSIVYFAALDRIITAGIPHPQQVLLVLLYNFFYILPLVIPLAIYLLLHKKVEELAARMHSSVLFWNRILMAVALLILGCLMVADSVWFYAFTRPIFLHRLI